MLEHVKLIHGVLAADKKDLAEALKCVDDGENQGEKHGIPHLRRGDVAELLKRPQINYQSLSQIDDKIPQLSSHEQTQLEVQIKYEGYIGKQMAQIERFQKLEGRKLPEDLDYEEIDGLRIEARQKLNQIRPVSLGQASRISGVSPADINVLLVYFEKQRRLKKQ